MPPVVEGRPPALDRLQHIRGDGWVVDVTTDLAASHVLEERQGESVTHRIEINIRTEFAQCFKACCELRSGVTCGW